MIPHYSVKWLHETCWAVGIAAAVFILTALLGIDSVSDWRAWVLSLVSGTVRVVAAVALNQIRTLFDGTLPDATGGSPNA
jgi:hypothetical protein